MKISLFFTTLILFCLAMPMEASAQDQAAGPKILIAYFSKTGNTESVAREIQKQTGGDLFKIETSTPYPEDHRQTIEVAKKEQGDNARPALKGQVANLADYEVVFLGYPNWWGTLPMALFTFLESYDFSGKTIIPFCTHGGSGLGRSAADIKKLCPGATLLEGLALRGNAGNAVQDITDWLRKNAITAK